MDDQGLVEARTKPQGLLDRLEAGLQALRLVSMFICLQVRVAYDTIVDLRLSSCFSKASKSNRLERCKSCIVERNMRWRR